MMDDKIDNSVKSDNIKVRALMTYLMSPGTTVGDNTHTIQVMAVKY